MSLNTHPMGFIVKTLLNPKSFIIIRTSNFKKHNTMANENIVNFVRFCKDKIIDELSKYEGQQHYACDLGYTLTEDINANGTFTYSTELAKEYIKEWWEDASDYWEYEKTNFGENFHNPFENPEGYTVAMVIEGVNLLLSQCKFIDEKWNEEIELTEENIQTITEQVEELDEDEPVF